MREHPDCAISQTDEIWIRDGRRVNPGLRHLKRAGDIFIDSLQTCLISPSAVILKTDLFRALGGFDEDLAAAEDYDLWLRILVDHEAGLLDEPLVTRRAGHSDQLSSSIPAIDRFRVIALMKLLANDQSFRSSSRRGGRSARRKMPDSGERCAASRSRERNPTYMRRLRSGAPRWRTRVDDSLLRDDGHDARDRPK